MDESDQIIAYYKQGFYCSQILIIEGLNMLGKSNPDLIRVMQGLAGGLGFTGELCGGLSGGSALLGLYAGKGAPDQEEDPRLQFMIADLVKWFKEEYGQQYGGIRCVEILDGNKRRMGVPCPALVLGTLRKVKELLIENGFELSGIIE